MNIKRMINGREYDFELTQEEMYNAYYEQQERFDREDIYDFLDGYDSDESFEQEMRITKEEFKELAERIRVHYRELMDDYYNHWTDARYVAIEETICDCLKEKG